MRLLQECWRARTPEEARGSGVTWGGGPMQASPGGEALQVVSAVRMGTHGGHECEGLNNGKGGGGGSQVMRGVHGWWWAPAAGACSLVRLAPAVRLAAPCQGCGEGRLAQQARRACRSTSPCHPSRLNGNPP